MFKNKMLSKIAVLMMSVTLLVSCNKDDDHQPNPQPVAKKIWKIKTNENDSTIFNYKTTGELHQVITTNEEDQPGPVIYNFAYNTAGKISEVSATSGVTFKFRYENNMLTFTETHHEGKKISENYYQYENSRLASTTLFSPFPGNPGVVTYKPTFKTTYSYDGSGRVEKITSYVVNPATEALTKSSEKQINQYDNAKNPLTVVNPITLATFFEFQADNNVNKETLYDEDGNVEETTVNTHVYDSGKYPVTTSTVTTSAFTVPLTMNMKYYYK